MMKLVSELLEIQARDNPEKIAIIHKSREISYDELNRTANRLAQWLFDLGVKLGDRVIVFGENSDRFVTAIFGCLKAGAVFVPLHPDLAAAKLDYIIGDCKPTVIITDKNPAEFADFFTVPSIKAVLLLTDPYPLTEVGQIPVFSWDQLSSFTDNAPNANIESENIAAIIYTSGSTKNPKGVVEAHHQIIFATSAINRRLGNTTEDIILCGLPLSFDYGLYQVFLAFQAGACLFLERDFSVPMAIPTLLRNYQVTGLPGVPSLFALLLQSKLLERIGLPHLRYITSTGDVFPASHIKRLKELLPQTTVFPMYGLTECKRVSIMPAGEIDGHEASVGKPLPGTSVSIVNEAEVELPAGEIGELVVRGPHIMNGYWNDLEETSSRFHDDGNGERHLHTKDYFKVDEDGFLYYVGRNEMIIKSRGQRISPAEVEAVICSINGVAEAAAVGVPDPVLGEAIHAFVSLTTNVMNETQIMEYCKDHLTLAAWPKSITIVRDLLPKTENGKIDRKQLKAQVKS